ncbi:hypothetical protein VTH06DRAFT_5307 [Thermothelomyces fergusii]
MAPYESESSGSENGDYTETDVLLGYASADANGEEISRLGGRPLNAELPDRFPNHERRLYVFTCKRKSCRRKDGNIRAIRGIRISVEAPPQNVKNNAAAQAATPQKASSQGLGEALFGVKPAATAGSAARANPFAPSSSANPFAPKASSSASTPANPFAKPQPPTEPPKPDAGQAAADLPRTFAETLSLNNPQEQQAPVAHGPPWPPEPWPELSAQPAPYPVRWLADAEYETLDPIPLPAAPTGPTAMDIDSEEGSGGGGKEDKEVFESTMDKTFQKFADRVGQNPEQCIRYEFAGEPLLYSKADAVGKMLHASEKEGKCS